jgi:hypothetical protein
MKGKQASDVRPERDAMQKVGMVIIVTLSRERVRTGRSEEIPSNRRIFRLGHSAEIVSTAVVLYI